MNFIKAFTKNAKQPVIKTSPLADPVELEIQKTLKEVGLVSMAEIHLADINCLFDHFIKAYDQGKISLLTLSVFCEKLFKVTNSWAPIIHQTKPKSLVLLLADVHIYLDQNQTPPFLKSAEAAIQDYLKTL